MNNRVMRNPVFGVCESHHEVLIISKGADQSVHLRYLISEFRCDVSRKYYSYLVVLNLNPLRTGNP